jgi:hypothetical protein
MDMDAKSYVMDMDAKSYGSRNPHKVLAQQGRVQEKEGVLDHLSRRAQALHSFCCLHGWPDWLQSSRAPQKALAVLCIQMGTTLLSPARLPECHEHPDAA